LEADTELADDALLLVDSDLLRLSRLRFLDVLLDLRSELSEEDERAILELEDSKGL
jgi:hypothetical protein